MPDVPVPYTTGRDNEVGRRTTVPKLNGRVYTPDALARRVVDGLPMSPGSRWLDPSCGDGAFLRAVLSRAREEGVAGLHVEGWDIDPDALTAADTGLRALAEAAGATLTLVHRDALEPLETRYDVVVGNPPYLESKRMSDALKKQLRAGGWVAAVGAFDLYAVFVELASRRVRAGGRFALIVPNRVLVTTAAAGLRGLLLGGGTVCLEDRSGAGDFGTSAAVYPVVLSWHAGGERTLTVRGGEGGLPGALVAQRLGGLWSVAWPGAGGALLLRVLGDHTLRPFGESFDVKWTVSFHRAGLRDTFVTPTEPATPWARRFLGGGRFAGNRELDAGRIDWAGGWIDYDEARARAAGNALPPVALFDGPKVVIVQNARRCRAALDRTGLVLKDTFLLVRPRDGADADRVMAWLVAVLHSDVFHALYAQLFAGTRKGGGYLHFLGSYLSVVPIPAPPAGWSPEQAVGGSDEAAVRRAYGLSPDEEAWLDAAAVGWALPC